MLKKVKFYKGEFKIGHRLQWAVYSGDGTLLLKEGTVLETQRQLDVVIRQSRLRGETRREMELYEKQRSIKNKQGSKAKKYFSDNVFKMKDHCAKLTEELLVNLVTARWVDAVDETASIYDLITRSCEHDANAALAAVHLSKEFSYSVLHPLHTAILCKVLINRLSFSEDQQRSIISAALTMNVGMYELQEVLFTQKDALTSQQKKGILKHPKESVFLLRQAGVKDKAWLDIILQHHERINGSGYPDKKSGNTIHQGAKIVALADIYSAMITPRLHRKPIAAQSALKKIFSQRGKEVDEVLAQRLISEVGVFPPGSFVTLRNNETALVVKRAIAEGNSKTSPQVCSILDPQGDPYRTFIMRDTADEMYGITTVCQPTINMPLNYEAIWGCY